MSNFQYQALQVSGKTPQYVINDPENLPIVSFDCENTANEIVEHLNSEVTGYTGKGDMCFNFKIFDPNKKLIANVSGMSSATKLLAHLNREH